ncbi:Uncharacterised protein [Vibrio cholerae]|nr:Uncharacterised protein [Vibrio cholerae]
MFSSASCLNGGIQRQQVGLLGNRLDHIEYRGDRLAFMI